MMKIKRFCGFFCILLIFCTAIIPINANTAHDAQSIMDGILRYELEKSGAPSVQEWINGEIAANAGITAEWYVLALRQSGECYDFSAYETALLRYLSENDVTSSSTRQKYALTLHAVGSSDGYISQALGNSIGHQGIMSWVYGLHLLNNGYACPPHSAESVISTILSMQLEDGGWAVSGTVSDVDVTAMTLQALAPHSAAYAAEIDRAVSLLSQRQLEDGGFMSCGVPNPESTSQVISALSALGIDCMTDERFLKKGNSPLDNIAGFRLADGSFSHTLGGTANHNATVQVFFAMTAYRMLQNGEGSMYLFAARPQPETTEIPPTQPPTENVQENGAACFSGNYRLYTAIIIAGAWAVFCIILFLKKKRHPKHYIAVSVIAVIGIAAVWLTDIQSAQDYYGGESTPAQAVGTVTLSIRCDLIAGKTDAPHIPENGVILDKTEYAFSAGDTVFDILTQAARTNGIHMEYSGSPEMAYIQGIGNVYEFDFGDLSGWVYHVNGESPSVGCGEYTVSDGDVIEWLYSLDLGNDLQS